MEVPFPIHCISLRSFCMFLHFFKFLLPFSKFLWKPNLRRTVLTFFQDKKLPTKIKPKHKATFDDP